MKKKQITLLVLIIAGHNFSYAQKQTNHWYFRQKAGLDFSNFTTAGAFADLTCSTITITLSGSVAAWMLERGKLSE